MLKNYNEQLISALHSFFWYEGLLEQEEDEWVDFKVPGQTYLYARPKYREDDIIHKLITALRSSSDKFQYFTTDDCEKIFGRDKYGTNNIFSRYSMLWQMLVEMFGSCGTSPRTGWIEKREDCANFLEMIVNCEELRLLKD